ncbi:hypothetical protein FEV16_13105 [Methylocystis sp. B8]|nr:hypothetical protein FEV16_13105 [Methylocystis sp. B8]
MLHNARGARRIRRAA